MSGHVVDQNSAEVACRWVDEHGDALLAFALSRLNARETAEDLVQETLLAAWQNYAAYEGRAAERSWLIAILRNKIADHLRRHGRQRRASEKMQLASSLFDAQGEWREAAVPWRDSPAMLAENAEFWEVFRRCLTAMPDHLTRVFQARVIAQRSTHVACQELGVSPSNLAVRLHRARLLLRDCLNRRWFREGAPREEGHA